MYIVLLLKIMGGDFMLSKTSEDYTSNRAWLRDITGGENVILRCVSALEYLQLFVGYVREHGIDVYAKKKGQYDNVNYHIVDTFDGIDFIRHGNVLCASAIRQLTICLTILKTQMNWHLWKH